MLLCTSVIALISLILISQSKATFLPKEIRVLMSGVSRSELAHRHHSDGAGTFFFLSNQNTFTPSHFLAFLGFYVFNKFLLNVKVKSLESGV